MEIKLLPLRSSISDHKELDTIKKDYLDSLLKEANGDLSFVEVKKTQNDINVFLIETGGTEELFLKLSSKLKGKTYLLTTGMNNSLAASIEIQTYMRSLNKECLIIHGTPSSVVKELKSIFVEPKEKSLLEGQRLGVIGHPSNWLIASMVDYNLIYKKTGITLVDISSSEFNKEIDKSVYEENKRITELKDKWDKKEDIEYSFIIYGALKRLISKYQLNGLTVRCFDLLEKYKNTSCLALAILNDEGYTATCEGDVPSMITMHMCKLLLKEKSFQANPSRLDIDNNQMVFAHCTIPFGMVNEYQLFTHFESNLGVAIRGKLDLKDITVLRFNNDLSKIFISEGHIEENLEETRLCRTQIRITLKKNINYFLSNPCGNHHIIIYGKHASKLAKFVEKLGTKVI